MSKRDAQSRPIVRDFDGVAPRIHPRAWLAPGAVVVGDVELGADVSIWYGSVLRGDVNHIRIGARSNVQDQCTIHVTTDRYPTLVEEDVTIGHRAVVHGCRIGAEALIGIGALVLDGAVVEPGALVGAGAVVTPGSVVPSGMLAIGVPARAVRPLDDQERRLQLERTRTYVATARRHAASGPVAWPDARSQGEPDEADESDERAARGRVGDLDERAR